MSLHVSDGSPGVAGRAAPAALAVWGSAPSFCLPPGLSTAIGELGLL